MTIGELIQELSQYGEQVEVHILDEHTGAPHLIAAVEDDIPSEGFITLRAGQRVS